MAAMSFVEYIGLYTGRHTLGFKLINFQFPLFSITSDFVS